MNATTIMLAGIGLGVVGRWAHNEKAVPDAEQTVSVIFALLLIAALDQGRTQGIARGFALLFLAAVLLSNNSPLTGLSKIGQNKTSGAVGAGVGNLATNVKG